MTTLSPAYLNRLADDIQSGDTRARDHAAMLLRRLGGEVVYDGTAMPAKVKRRGHVVASLSVGLVDLQGDPIITTSERYEYAFTDMEWEMIKHIGPQVVADKAGLCLHNLIRDTPQARLVYKFYDDVNKDFCK